MKRDIVLKKLAFLKETLSSQYGVSKIGLFGSTIRGENKKNETLKRAVTRSLEIIGEATKKIPADVKYEWNDISWKQMAGMRDKLIHDYMGVNYLIVWDVAKNIIPVLIPQIEAIIDNEKENRINR